MANNPVLVDTSAWIFALRKDPLPAIKERIDLLLKEDTVTIVPIVKLELLGGTKTKGDFNRLKGRLDALDSIELNEQVWEKAVYLAFNLRRKGITIPYTDILISAAAMQEGAILLHADAHFDLIAQYCELRVESFASAIQNR